jgi:hypothetical protein
MCGRNAYRGSTKRGYGRGENGYLIVVPVRLPRRRRDGLLNEGGASIHASQKISNRAG